MQTFPWVRACLATVDRCCPRRLWQAAIPYVAVAWVVLQLGDVLGETWGWSAGVMQALQVLLGGGLLVTLVLAWFHGEPGRQRVTPFEVVLLTVIAGLTVGGAAWRTTTTGAAVLPANAGRGGLLSVAVAPFDFEGGGQEDGVFARGMRDGIVSRLMTVPGLRVVDVAPQRGWDATGPGLATRLGVEYVLTGSLESRDRRMTTRVTLATAADLERVWSRTYRDDLSTDHLIDVQREVAAEVATSLRGRLDYDDHLRSADEAVRDIEAYRSYLEGSALFEQRFDVGAMRGAVAAFEAALAGDPDFPAALASLVHAHSWMTWQFQERGGKEAARGYLDHLYALDPDQIDTHLAAAYYHYYATRDFDSALRELRVVVRRRPGDVWAWAVKGYVERRLGLWESSLDSQRRAAELDPGGARVAYNLGRTLHRLGRYGEADAQLRRAVRLEPGRALYVHGLMSLQLARGDTAAMRKTLDDARGASAPGALYDEEQWLLSIQGRYREALSAWAMGRGQEGPGSWHARAAVLAWLAGDAATARTHADSLRGLAEEELSEVRTGAGGPRPNVVLGELALAAAILGDAHGAMELGERSVDPLTAGADAYDGSLDLHRLAVTWMVLGDHDRAVRTLERILAGPGEFSHAAYDLLPEFAPLRDRPDYARLPAGYGPRL